MTAPQWIMIGQAVLMVVAAIVLDGKEREGRYNGALMVIGAAAQLAVLWWGGFFS